MEKELKKFSAGVLYNAYEVLGAHIKTTDGEKGTHFVVWAPCARQVSVVGDFNRWDGSGHRMTGLSDHGVFELFIPGVGQGDIYKYEIETQSGEIVLKADPYGTYAELRPNNASIVWDVDHFRWSDQEWMDKRVKTGRTAGQNPLSVYEVHLGSWMRKPYQMDEAGNVIAGSEFLNYRELAVKLAAYVKEMGYTHIELMPIMEHPLDRSWGYQVTGYYAPTSRHGSPDDFQYFMNYMHEQGIGVILDWVPAQFPRDLVGLARFDGTCVYEHKDPRQGEHPMWGTLVYNYGRPQVSNFLIANALYWVDKFHVDGIRVNAVDAMLYLDYGKNPGQWIPNIYGGNENLDAVEFVKHLASIFHRREDGALLIAEEFRAWPQVTGDLKDGGLGFDFKWNSGWLNDTLNYAGCPLDSRSRRYRNLSLPMLYAYSEAFVLAFHHDELAHGRGSMVSKMPGDTMEVRLANLRVLYGFWMTHPGKKLMFMGQELARISEWNEENGLPWELLEQDAHRKFQDYVKALNLCYRSHPALYELDHHPDGFEWIDCLSGQENIIVFLRKAKNAADTLLVVCNFGGTYHKDYRIGVPLAGRYETILDSNQAVFGGNGGTGCPAIVSEEKEWDGRGYSVKIEVAPFSIQIFACISYDNK